MRLKSLLFALPICGAWLWCGTAAHAVVLQQKWRAGQHLHYDVSMDGTVDLKAPAEAAIFFAGIPVRAKVQVKSKTRLDTVSVDEAGIGTLSPHLEQLTVTGSQWGMSGQFTLNDGKVALLANGEPAESPVKLDGKLIADPPVTIDISKTGHLESVALVPPATPVSAKPGAATEPEHLSAKIAMFINSWLTRTLPALWPDRDVQPGDTWTAPILVPPAAASTATGNGSATLAASVQIGEFKFLYKGEELVDGRKLQHVSVDGQVTVDADHAAALSEKAAKFGSANLLKGVRLTGATQSVVGDLWFDADAGELVHAVLNLHSHGDGALPKAQDAPPATEPAKPSTFDFTGVLQIQLRDGAGQ